MSGPVPSPSMNGMMGFWGTSSLPEVIVMGSPEVGSGSNGMMARECTARAAGKRASALVTGSCDFREPAHDPATQHGQELALELRSSGRPASHGKVAPDRLPALEMADPRAVDTHHVVRHGPGALGHLEARLDRILASAAPVGPARLLAAHPLEKALHIGARL